MPYPSNSHRKVIESKKLAVLGSFIGLIQALSLAQTPRTINAAREQSTIKIEQN